MMEFLPPAARKARQGAQTLDLPSRYRLVRELGEGSMGRVILVEDTATGQRVGLKMLSSRPGRTAKTLLQFKQEFRLAAQLKHPNCCQVLDFGLLDNGDPYFTMEYIDAPDLGGLFPLSAERFESYFAQLLGALASLHQLGLVHGDLKSENVRVTADDVVKLMDFGLVAHIGETGAALRGTLGYMPPEGIKGGRIDPRSDLYALGALAYEALTGALPFAGRDLASLIRAQLAELPPPPSVRAPSVPAQYDTFVMTLLAKDPLDRYPSAYAALDALGVPTPSADPGMLLSAPLVGREPEMGRLLEALGRVTGGEAGGVLWLEGLPGVGKSRLVEEFRLDAQLAGLPFAIGHCLPAVRSPYAPVMSALASLMPDFAAHVPSELARLAPVLARWLPEAGIAGFPADVKPAEELEPVKEQLRWQTAVNELLSALARRTGLIVVLEDWHWADAASEQWLTQWGLAAGGFPALVVVTSAPTQPERPKWLDAAQVLTLDWLDTPAVKRLVAAKLGTTDVSEALASQVAAFAEGRPTRVGQLMAHWVATGALVSARGRWTTARPLTNADMPNDLRGLAMEQLAGLPSDAMALVRLAAVAGAELDLEVLQDATGFGDERLLDALEALSRRQVFRRTERGTYAFAQAQLQAYVLGGLSAADRAERHRLIGQALARRLGDSPLEEAPLSVVAAIADHHLAAGDREPAILFALEAGMRSSKLFANADAERYLQAGLTLVNAAGPAPPAATRLDYLRTLADVWRVTGHVDSAREAYAEAIGLAEADHQLRHLGQLWTSLAKVHQGLDQLPEALDCCERAQAYCLEVGDLGGAARCLLTSARIEYFRGHVAEASGQMSRALSLAEAAGDKSRQAEALAFIGYMRVASHDGPLEDAVDSLHESIAILSELGDMIGLNLSYMLLGNAQTTLGDYASATKSFSLARWICQEIGNRTEEGIALINLTITALEQGELVDAVANAGAARRNAVQLQHKFQMGLAAALEAIALAYVGRHLASPPLMTGAIALARELGNKYMEALILPYAIELSLWLGQLDDARATGRTLEALMAETGHSEHESRLHALMTEVAGRLGEPGAALVHAERAARTSEALQAQGMQARAAKAAAWLSAQTGDLARARRLAVEARDLARRLAMRQLEAELDGLLGEIALASGQSDAAGHFQAMATLAHEVGSPLLEAIALAGFAAAQKEPTAVHEQASARRLMTGLLAGMEPAARSAFVRPIERQRTLESL